jgi:hypothetical protein
VHANPAGIPAPHREVSVIPEGNAPAITDYPLALGGLTHDGYGVVEGFLGTITERTALLLAVRREISGRDHGGHCVAFTQLVLDGQTTLLWQIAEPIDFVLLDCRIVDHILPTGKRVTSLGPVRIGLLRDQPHPHSILEPLGNIALLASIDKIVLTGTIDQLLF